MSSKKRSRKRRKQQRHGTAPVGTPEATAVEEPSAVATGDAQRATASRRAAGKDGPPPPPWGSFPLSELVIFVGIVLLVAGFFIGPPQGTVALVVGLALASLGGLELAVREHFAGYRSHTALLAGAVAIAVLATLLAVRAGPAIAAAAAAVVFGLCAWLLLGVFRRRSGGELYRVR
jgi:hypothetical protein